MREAAPPPVILHDYHRHFVFISAEGIEIESLTTNRRQGDPPSMKKACSSAASPSQHFIYRVDQHCDTMLGSNLWQKQLHQGQHLKKRCKLWAPTQQK